VENDPEGKPVRFPGVLIDITDRRRIEDRERYLTAEAIAANAKFRAVFDQTSVFAGIMALDGTLLDVNRLSLEACGYRADEVLGKPFWNTGWWLGSKEVQGKIRTATERAAQGTPYREVLPYYLADGTERLVEFALHPIVDPNGQIIFLHPTGVDITDLKRAEENYRKLAETLDGEVRIRTSELEQRNSEILQQSKLLQHFSQRLMKIQDEERRRIARELHDSAGQLLAALSMNLERAAHNARQHTAEIAEDVSDSQALVQQLSQEIRTMSYLLHPPLLDEAGLPDALRWYARGLTERSGIDITLTIREDFGRLPRELELVIFRLVQECLTNIHRHSGSKSADIQIAREGQTICLDVRDQGKGISAERLSEIQSQGSGVGIRGMGERVRQFHGEMKIESNGDGTTISFSFPLADAG
jgi:PAS domain S-box-containing protein